MVKQIDWEYWENRYVLGDEECTLNTISQEPGAPALSTLKRYSSRQKWADKKKQKQEPCKWEVLYVTGNDECSLEFLAKQQDAPSIATLKRRCSAESWAKKRAAFRLARSEITQFDRKEHKPVTNLDFKCDSYFDLFCLKLRKMFPGKDLELETPPGYLDGQTPSDETGWALYDLIIMKTAFSDPFIFGSKDYEPINNNALLKNKSELMLDARSIPRGKDSGPEIPCGLPLVDPRLSLTLFSSRFYGHASADLWKQTSKYLRGLAFLHVLDCPMCLLDLYEKGRSARSASERFLFYVGVAVVLPCMEDTWAYRLNEFWHNSMNEGETIYDFMLRQDRPMFRPHLYQ